VRNASVHTKRQAQLRIERTISKSEGIKAYHLVAVPNPVNDDKLIYIRREKSILWADKTRQYYYFSSDFELQKCKKPTKQGCVCKQGNPLMSSLVQEECAVRLLKVWANVTDSCEVNFAQLTHTAWTQVNLIFDIFVNCNWVVTRWQ
jgi:hypothetical protein